MPPDPDTASPIITGIRERARELTALISIARIATADLELRPMLQRIVDALHEYFGWEFIACVTVDQREGCFVCEAFYSAVPTDMHVGYSRKLGSGVVGEVALNGVSIDIENDVAKRANFNATLQGTRSELCVPVKHNGRVLAVLDVESATPGAFRGQRVLLETVAEQIAGALAAARLHEELRRRVELLAMMSDLSRNAFEARNFDQALERIAEFIRQRFRLENCAIVLVNPEGRLSMRALAGAVNPAVLPAGEWPQDRGIVPRAYRTGEAQYVPDVALDPDYLMNNPLVRSELALPIRVHDRLLGVINMESRGTDSFDAHNRAMLEALATQVAGAIHLASAARRMAEVNQLLEQRSSELETANAQLRHANVALHRLSQRDGLTGVANRRSFDAQLETLWLDACARQDRLALFMIDLDHFKAYNDNFGHLAGDDCLRRAASALDDALAAYGAELARYGGEEFVAVLPSVDDQQALAIAEQLRAALTALNIPHPNGSPITTSIGVATGKPVASGTAERLFQRADAALYEAKRRQRNCVVLAPPE